jgi:hypothetical protein
MREKNEPFSKKISSKAKGVGGTLSPIRVNPFKRCELRSYLNQSPVLVRFGQSQFLSERTFPFQEEFKD